MAYIGPTDSIYDNYSLLMATQLISIFLRSLTKKQLMIMNNKCYIAGRVTGDPHYKAKFRFAVATVTSYYFFDRHGHKIAVLSGRWGFQAVNPTAISCLGITIDRLPWILAMLFCIIKLASCSYAYFLNDWKQSRGARIEHRFARLTRKNIIYQ